jgi:protein-disulfide isomerase
MYLLLAVLPSICPLCVTTHVLNGLILIGTILLWPRAPKTGVAEAPYPSFRQLTTTVALACVVVWSVLMLHVVGTSAGQAKAEAAEYQKRLADFEGNSEVMWTMVRDSLLAEAQQAIPVDPDDPVFGRKDAKRTLVVFSDYQCPNCKKVHQHLRGIWPALEAAAAPQGGIRLVFKNYPLYSKCNPRSGTNMHAYSCDAAVAVEAARIVGGPTAFWKMADTLYEHQDELYLAPYAKLAEKIGLNVQDFEKARRSPEAKERVERQVRQAVSIKVRGTPSLYLDGILVKRLVGASDRVWRRVLASPAWPPTRESLR